MNGYQLDGYPCDVCGRPGWAEHDGLTLCGPCWNRATGHDDEDGDR